MERHTIARHTARGALAAALTAAVAAGCMASSSGSSATRHDHQSVVQASRATAFSPMRKEY